MTQSTAAPKLEPPVSDRDHAQGSAQAGLTLVEYGDYECPHCARAHPIVRAVQQRLGKRLRFVFRNFPLSTAHPHAAAAAEAAEGAAAQGKFWEMHDLLFENQHALEPEDLLAYASRLGLDARRLGAELASGAHRPRVQEDFMSGVRSGVNGTPTFFINGRRFDGSWDEEGLLDALENARDEPPAG
jgi:protein-disulfide isomerase